MSGPREDELDRERDRNGEGYLFVVVSVADWRSSGHGRQTDGNRRNGRKRSKCIGNASDKSG